MGSDWARSSFSRLGCRVSILRGAVLPTSNSTALGEHKMSRAINIGGIGRLTAETAIAITPDGKTAYIATSAYIAGSCPERPVGSDIPVATATGTPGKPINIGRIPKGIAIAP
jgi:DNA-binding beta-propeller fold protein YncE